MKFIVIFIVTLTFSCSTAYAQNSTFGLSQENNDRNIDDEYYSIYPNPSNGSIQLTITSTKVDQFKLKIYDVHGMVVFDKFFKGAFKGLNLDLKLKKSGLYFLVIESGNQRHVEKIMIKT